jgi:hypothetical protein
VRKGEHGTKVYFVKQLKDSDGEGADTRLVPTLREYTVLSVDQCEGLPDSIRVGRPMRNRNPDTRDALCSQHSFATLYGTGPKLTRHFDRWLLISRNGLRPTLLSRQLQHTFRTQKGVTPHEIPFDDSCCGDGGRQLHVGDGAGWWW